MSYNIEDESANESTRKAINRLTTVIILECVMLCSGAGWLVEKMARGLRQGMQWSVDIPKVRRRAPTTKNLD